MAERTGTGTPPAEPPSWPGVSGVRRLGFQTPAEVLSPESLESGLSGPGPHGCLPTGDRSALGRGPSDSDGHTSPWLIFDSDTGLPSNSRQPARLPLSGQGVPSRVGGDGPRAELLGNGSRDAGAGPMPRDPPAVSGCVSASPRELRDLVSRTLLRPVPPGLLAGRTQEAGSWRLVSAASRGTGLPAPRYRGTGSTSHRRAPADRGPASSPAPALPFSAS